MKKTDFRDGIYRHYVSTFKGQDDRPSQIAYRLKWASKKFLPLIDTCDRSLPVLDLGCGDGQAMDFLRLHGFQLITGVDVSQEQVDLARRGGNDVIVGDARDFLKPEEASYGLILALDFLEHFTKAEIVELLGLIFSRLEPGGVLLIQTPNGQGLFPGQVIYGDFSHLTILSPESLTQILRLSGFEEIQLDEVGPIPNGVAGRIQTALWQIVKTLAKFVRMIETGKRQSIWTESFICRARKPRKVKADPSGDIGSPL